MVQAKLFETGIRCGLKFLCQFGNRVIKLKVRKFWGIVPMFEEAAGEKLLGGVFLPPLPPFRIWFTKNSKLRSTCIHLHNMKIQKSEFKGAKVTYMKIASEIKKKTL